VDEIKFNHFCPISLIFVSEFLIDAIVHKKTQAKSQFLKRSS